MPTQAAIQQQKVKAGKIYSLKEYIAFEEQALERHEFTDGKLTAMAGTSDKHNEVCFNITALLKELFPDCKIYMENVKLQIAKDKKYVYPDVFVTCDKRDFENRFIKAFPTLICEVTSLSTQVHDRTTKFLEYKKLKTLAHYIVVDQYSMHVEYFYKSQKGVWDMAIFTKPEQVIKLEGQNIELSLSAIYK